LSKSTFHPIIHQLAASDYLHARDRARRNDPAPDFDHINNASDVVDSSNTLTLMKCAILTVEAALPLGSIDTSNMGNWNPKHARYWRMLVISAKGPAALMRCLILLEDLIVTEWVKVDVGYLRSCLPDRWKAVGEASASSLAIRVILLDRSLKYEKVDRKRFAKTSKKKK
jgi:hypothetical protein